MEIQTLEKGVKILNNLFHEFYSIHLTHKNHNSIFSSINASKYPSSRKKEKKRKERNNSTFQSHLTMSLEIQVPLPCAE